MTADHHPDGAGSDRVGPVPPGEDRHQVAHVLTTADRIRRARPQRRRRELRPEELNERGWRPLAEEPPSWLLNRAVGDLEHGVLTATWIEGKLAELLLAWSMRRDQSESPEYRNYLRQLTGFVRHAISTQWGRELHRVVRSAERRYDSLAREAQTAAWVWVDAQLERAVERAAWDWWRSWEQGRQGELIPFRPTRRRELPDVTVLRHDPPKGPKRALVRFPDGAEEWIPLDEHVELSRDRRRLLVYATGENGPNPCPEFVSLALRFLNEAADQARQPRSSGAAAMAVVVEAETPAPAEFERLVHKIRTECGLSDAVARAYVLRHSYRLDDRELAAWLGCTNEAARQRLSRAERAIGRWRGQHVQEGI